MRNSFKYIIITFLISLSSLMGYASENESLTSLFEKANQLYQSQKYEEAIILYDSICLSEIQSANLFLNMANTYYKMAKYTYAILYYEKAKKIEGNRDDINYNLELANLNIIDKIDPIHEFFLKKFWKQVMNHFSANKWAKLSITLFWIVILLIILIFWTRNIALKKAILPFTVLLCLTFLLTFSFSIQKKSLEKHTDYAIIFSPTVYVKSAPDMQSTDLFLIHEGLKVQQLDQVDNWSKIKLADGKIGWITNNTIKEI